MRRVVIGADVGGTSCRVAIAGLDGQVLGVCTGGPGNPTTLGFAPAAEQLRRLAVQALAAATDQLAASGPNSNVAGAGQPAPVVVAAVLGIAGWSALTGREATFAALAIPGLGAESVRVVSDFAVAFSSGTPAAGGIIAIAGTGAGAMRVTDGRILQRRDAWGWLLGDRGSAVWLGRQAMQATLHCLERGDSPGPLTEAVLAQAGTSTVSTTLQFCYAQPPTWLATLAMLVSETAAIDPIAERIAASAADQVLSSISALVPAPAEAVVLGGSVLTRPGPVQDRVVTQLSADLDHRPRMATDGLVGALWLALAPYAQHDPRVHQRLVSSAVRGGAAAE